MNKRFTILFVALLLVSVSVAVDVDCKNHPTFGKAKQMIQNAIKVDSKGEEQGQKLLDIFQNAQPVSKSAEDLGVCSQYAGYKSCCNKNITELLDKAALLKIKPLLQQKSAFQKIIKNFVDYSAVKKCPATTQGKTLSYESIMADAALTKLIVQRDEHKKCKTNFFKSIAQLTRGAMCSICAGVEKVSDYVENGKLKISAESQKKFQTAAETAIECIQGTINEDLLIELLLQIKELYAIGDCFKDVLRKIVINVGDALIDKGTAKCDGKQIFSPKVSCENAISGASGFDNNDDEPPTRLLRQEKENIKRILEVIDETISVESGGVDIFIPSKLDDGVNEDGNFQLNFEDPEDQSKTEPNNNALKLGFSSLLIVLTLIL